MNSFSMVMESTGLIAVRTSTRPGSQRLGSNSISSSSSSSSSSSLAGSSSSLAGCESAVGSDSVSFDAVETVVVAESRTESSGTNSQTRLPGCKARAGITTSCVRGRISSFTRTYIPRTSAEALSTDFSMPFASTYSVGLSTTTRTGTVRVLVSRPIPSYRSSRPFQW